MSQRSIDDALQHLITTFGELNGRCIEELDSEPSPLEFMRYVARNTPFVIRGGASSWTASRKWDKDYLLAALAGHSVNVAVTPYGNADAPATSPMHDDSLVFAKPHQELQPFNEFLNYIMAQETDPNFPPDAEVRYAQTQDDNLREEYRCLFGDAQKDIPFARIALQKPPEAINMWIGNSKSVTATHKDNFENIFVQIKGRKHFVLLSPLHYHCMNEQPLRPATYVRDSPGLSLRLDDDATPVPFVTWDLDEPLKNALPLSSLAQPIRVTLEPGDMLYLPAMWYHKVTQSVSEQDPNGFVVAINYWYDMDFAGPLFPTVSFLHAITLHNT